MKKIINKSIIRIYPQDIDQVDACLMAGKKVVTIVITEDEERRFTLKSDIPIDFEIIGRILFSNKRFCQTGKDWPTKDFMVLKVPGKYTELTDECFNTLAVFDEFDCTNEIRSINYRDLYELCIRFLDPTHPIEWDVPNRNVLRKYMEKNYFMEYVKFCEI